MCTPLWWCLTLCFFFFLFKATIKEATKGMTAEEEKQFRDKMKALMGVLEDEVKELQVQHTKLMVSGTTVCWHVER